MAIVRIDKDRVELLSATSLKVEGVRERMDLQRLLKKTIDVIGSDLLVIAEEFGEWEEAVEELTFSPWIDREILL